MSLKLSIRPREGLKLKDPATGRMLVPDRNTMVDANQFWYRRLRDKDVVEMKAEKPTEEKKKKVSRSQKSEDNSDSK